MDDARARAAALGDPSLAPPVSLERCDRDALELAFNKPAAGFAGIEIYPTFPDKIAALLYSLSKSQACIDGNKRVALLLTISFTRTNGGNLELRPNELADMILAIADSELRDHDTIIAETSDWIAARLREA